MREPLQFRTDLYRGTAAWYERYRLPYPAAMLDDLLARVGARGDGRLLDLACGTGRLTSAGWIRSSGSRPGSSRR